MGCSRGLFRSSSDSNCMVKSWVISWGRSSHGCHLTGQIIATSPHWRFSKGIPLISGKSRLVKYHNLARFKNVRIISHTIPVWYIYRHCLIVMVHVGKYTIHACYGYALNSLLSLYISLHLFVHIWKITNDNHDDIRIYLSIFLSLF